MENYRLSASCSTDYESYGGSMEEVVNGVIGRKTNIVDVSLTSQKKVADCHFRFKSVITREKRYVESWKRLIDVMGAFYASCRARGIAHSFGFT